MSIQTQDDLDKAINACFDLTDDREALKALESLVREPKAPGLCAPKLVLLTRGGCEPCAEEKARRKDELAEGVIEEIDIDSPRGQDISKRCAVDWTPALLPLDCNDNLLGE